MKFLIKITFIVCTLFILTACKSSGSGSSSEPSTTSSDTSADENDSGRTPIDLVNRNDEDDIINGDENRWDIESYGGIDYDKNSIYGLWVLAGEESLHSQTSADQDTGTRKRRMFFNIRPTSTVGESEIRTCFLAEGWIPFDGDTPEIMLSNLIVSFEQEEGVVDRAVVTVDLDINDEDGSTFQLDGNYGAVKISDSTSADLGSLKLTSYITDKKGLSKKVLFNNLDTDVRCMTETDGDFVAAAHETLSDLQRQALDAIDREEETFLGFDEAGLTLTEHHTTTGTKGYTTTIYTDRDNDSYIAVGDGDNNTYNYLNRTTTKHKGNISSVNHLDDYASAEFDLNF